MWRIPGDHSEPVIQAKEQVNSAHRKCSLVLPNTAIVFFMSRGVDCLCARHGARELPEPFPRFLNRCPIWQFGEYPICFLDGGRGAPQACDTVETLAALGAENVIAIGMCGGFDPRVRPGDILIPEKAFVEEGTSLHYYDSIEFSAPDSRLLELANAGPAAKPYPIVSTDAVYRQTFEKERLWREEGAVAVDMEMSAVFSVSRYLGLKAVGLLMVSDLHPPHPGAPKWEWRMTGEMRDELTEKGLWAAKRIAAEQSAGWTRT